MSLDWFKSVSAQIGVEGRNIVIVAGLVFCAFGLWLFLSGYKDHPLLSWVFVSAFFLLGASIALIGLLVKPQPSEIAQKFLLQQVGQQFFYAGGLQSPSDVLEVLRTLQNIRPLPPPSAVVEGSASNEGEYKPLSPEEAAALAAKDREGIERMIRLQAERIQTGLGVQQAAAEAPKQITASNQAASQSDKGKKEA
ncbi:MAG TPA: hypothetical protein VKM93_13500 [Terriglobia bacterium]|nr:hypothetical protein [Terriglobia bacterium]